MTGRRPLALLIGGLTATALALLLGGCGYDYLQHTDRVAFTSGDAVKANLESETTDPSRRSTYKTSGMGRNGVVAPATTAAAAPASAPATAN